MTPSLGPINLLEQITELRELVCLLDCSLSQKILKDTNQQPHEEVHRVKPLTKESLS